jgi:hypothetical protein
VTVRIANAMGGRSRCDHCDDSGVAIVGIEVRGGVEYDVAGPCPLCQRGFRLEFGIGAKRTADGTLVEYENPRGGPWGADGFWRGRETQFA